MLLWVKLKIMRNSLSILLLILSIGCGSNKIPEPAQNEKEIHKINDIYTFTIKEILSDSRCPKDVQCVWEGQVELVISIYENEKFLKDELIVLNAKNFEINRSILERYTLNKKIIRICFLTQEQRRGNKTHESLAYW